MDEPAELLHLSGTDVRARRRAFESLCETRDLLGSCSRSESRELVKGAVDRPGTLQPLNPDEQGPLGGRQSGHQRKATHAIRPPRARG